MRTKLIEITQDLATGRNWGKVLVCQFTDEWQVPSVIRPPWPLLRQCGWGGRELLIVDMQTGEGALFDPPGSAHADLEKREVWVCPMFEPALEWIYEHGVEALFALDPPVLELPDAEFAMAGYRRGVREKALSMVRDIARMLLDGEGEDGDFVMEAPDNHDTLSGLIRYARHLLGWEQ